MANPDSDDVDLHGHQQSVKDHQQGRDAEPQVLEPDAKLCELPQLDGLGYERQHPVDEEDWEQSETVRSLHTPRLELHHLLFQVRITKTISIC